MNTDNKDDSEDLRSRVVEAHNSHTPLRIVGGDTKQFYANALVGEPLYTKKHLGIISY